MDADGLSATGRFPALVELEHELPHSGTVAEMARLQGAGSLHITESRTLFASYLKRNGAWAIAAMELRS